MIRIFLTHSAASLDKLTISEIEMNLLNGCARPSHDIAVHSGAENCVLNAFYDQLHNTLRELTHSRSLYFNHVFLCVVMLWSIHYVVCRMNSAARVDKLQQQSYRALLSLLQLIKSRNHIDMQLSKFSLLVALAAPMVASLPQQIHV